MSDKHGIVLPFGWDTLLPMMIVIGGGIYGFGKVYQAHENRFATLEAKIERVENVEIPEANKKIEELVERHIQEENERIEQMEEQVKFYQKEFNINPFAKRKKKE